MTATTTPHPMIYFGKLPSRGDFVRSNQGGALIHSLDRWLTGGLEAMSADVRWKVLYDRAASAHFAFLGTRSSLGLAGHLQISSDASGRRFPFITAHRMDVGPPLPFIARSPLLLARSWQRLDHAARRAQSAQDATPLLTELSQSSMDFSHSLGAYEASFTDFLELHTIASVQAMLQQAGHAIDLRRLLLGLGLLLQPVLNNGGARLGKGLSLPLPRDPLYRPLLGAFWLDLISGFLARSFFELTMFLPQGPADHGPRLTLGFDGASPRTLHALLDPAVDGEVNIDCCQADWVEDHLGNDPSLNKLSSYLQQGGLSMRQAADTFKHVFLGS